jgi:hypothetical protein
MQALLLLLLQQGYRTHLLLLKPRKAVLEPSGWRNRVPGKVWQQAMS